MLPIRIAQAVAGVGGLRVTFQVPDAAPDPCGVELCLHNGAGDVFEHIESLSALPIGAASSIDGDAVSIRTRRMFPCKPGGFYRVTLRGTSRPGSGHRIVGRVVTADQPA